MNIIAGSRFIRWAVLATVSGLALGSLAPSATGQNVGEVEHADDPSMYEPSPVGPRRILATGTVLGRDYVVTNYPSSAGPCFEIEFSDVPGMRSGGCGASGAESDKVTYELLTNHASDITYFWGVAPRSITDVRLAWNDGTEEVIPTRLVHAAVREAESKGYALFISARDGQVVVQRLDQMINGSVIDTLKTEIPAP